MNDALQDSAPTRRDAAHEAAVCARLRRRRRRRSRRSGAGLALRVSLFALGGVVLLAAAAISALYLMLARGPVSAEMLGARIAAAIDSRLGENYDVTVGRTTIESGDFGPFIAVEGLRITSGGEQVFAAPRATVALHPLRLLMGQVSPKRIELFDLDLQLSLTADGAVAVSAGAKPFLFGRAPEPAGQGAAAPPPLGEHAAVRAIGDALRRTLAIAIGAQTPLGSIEHVGISRGRLVVDDRAVERTTTFDELELSIDRDRDAALLTIAATGPSGRWSVSAQARADSDSGAEGPRSLDVEVRDLSMDEIALMFGLRSPPVDFDMPVSARLQLSLGEEGRLTTADGRFAIGSGFLYFRDGDQEPVRVDEMTGRINWDAAARRFDVGPISFHSGRTHMTFAGRVDPPDGRGSDWRLDLASSPGVLGAVRPGFGDVEIQSARMVARLDLNAKTFNVERFDVSGPHIAAALSADGQWTAGDRRIRTNIDVNKTSFESLLRLWPSFAVAKTRAWFLSHRNSGTVESGRAEIDLDEAAFIALGERRGIAESAVTIEGSVHDVALVFMPGVPAISGVAGKVRVTGKTASFVASGGFMETAPGKRLTLAEGKFEAGEFGSGLVKAQVNVRASGNVDAVGELIAAEGLKPFGGFAIESGLVRGHVDGRVSIDLFLEPERAPAVRVATQISNLSVERVIGRERLDQGSLALTADATGMRAMGQGRLLGNQVRIDLRKPPGAPTEASITMQLDEAARARQGWQSSAITGPVGVKVTTLLGMGEKAKPLVEVDLARAAINSLGGFSKPAGRAAKASFSLLQEPQQITLQSFAFEAGAASAQGVIELDNAGAFTSASFSQLKLSPGDDMKVDVAQLRDGSYRAQVRATSIDARPFIQDLLGGGREQSQSAGLDLDLRSNLVTGANGQAMSNVELKLVTRSEGVKEFRLSARSGRSPVTGGALAARQGAPQQFFVRTDDGGALLSFLDLYRRMDGGQLQLVGYGTNRSANGVLNVRNFTLRNEATLQKLVAEGARGREAQLPIDPSAVPFDRLEVAFTRTGGRLDLRDGVVSGPSIGATIEGGIDFTRDQVALNGTFVPAYGLNNMFSRIPLFGPLLGGGANEGLIGINFRITGSASAPVLSLNPLSAMTPGFLRKIFGAAESVTLPPQSFPAQPEPAAPGAPR
ncbi:MAG: AsmA-like C-terminal region-containing protein [Beijerinckiaceae bacterium]